MSSAFALYRLPHTDSFIRVEGDVQEVHSCEQLNGQTGFVVAPFEAKPELPILLISPHTVSSYTVAEAASDVASGAPTSSDAPVPIADVSPDYHIDFANFHAQLELGIFQKIVLARCVDEPAAVGVSAEDLFMRACQLYPRMFIALVHTPKSGTWLTATPEILLEGKGSQWRTIALAGTMKLEGEQLKGEGESLTWSIKNIKEQRLVATYIAECLERYADDFREEGPRTVRAANLVHLCSEFSFTLPSNDSIGNLLQTLHPTPAVCGLPKREAFRFIVGNEHTPRRYYSGFMGMLDPRGETHLYVSLRCMNIDSGFYHLYAGGGLLQDSTEQQEWQETEAKLETMRRCIAIEKA